MVMSGSRGSQLSYGQGQGHYSRLDHHQRTGWRMQIIRERHSGAVKPALGNQLPRGTDRSRKVKEVNS